MQALVSVIVPVYKVEMYLGRYVDSILAQTHQNLEVILVDDGSPDNCPAICDAYAAKDKRIKVIHKVNGGLSDARNAGLAVAAGEWLSFIDSDDWIEPDMYEELIGNAQKTDAEISVGGVSDEILENGIVTVLKTTFHGEEKIELLSCIDAMNRYFRTSWSAWDKIYRREIFDGIKYPVGEINEDEAIALRLLDRCQNIVYTNKIFYHYIHRPESITTSDFSEKKLAWYWHCNDNLAWAKDHHTELEINATERLCRSILWSMREIALSSNTYTQAVSLLQNDIRSNYLAYRQCALNQPERLRLGLLKLLPFSIYKAIERIMKKRNLRRNRR